MSSSENPQPNPEEVAKPGPIAVPPGMVEPETAEPANVVQPEFLPAAEALVNAPAEAETPHSAPAPETVSAEKTPAVAVPPPATPPAASPPSVKIQIRERLPNASVGKPFKCELRKWLGEQADRISEFTLNVTDGIGLIFDEPTGTLQGTPTKPGEISTVLSYRLAGTPADRPALTHTLALTVNPDPSSLWKNLPSNKDGPFWKEDAASASLVTPHLTVLAASLRGRSHAHEGKYREDDFGLKYIEATGWHILIVADGAGSAKFSRKGSQLACQTALAEIEERIGMAENPLDEALAKLGASDAPDDLEKLRKISSNVLMPAAYKAHTAIIKQAKESQATLRDFATTFIAVIARRIADRWFFASFAIGDGGAGVVLEDGRVLPLTAPDSGDFAGQTVFLTMANVYNDLARTQAKFCTGFKFLAAMTDGITDPIFQSDAGLESPAVWEGFRTTLAEKIALDAPAPGMETALLDWLNFPSPGNHDDRTLLVAVPTLAKP